MSTDTVVKLSDHISTNFYEFWNTDKSEYILKGGRSSLKSSAISIKLVNMFLEDDKANIVCLRKVGKYLATSVYEQIRWAINTMQVSHEFTFQKSPLKIIHKRTKTAFYFFGVDEPEKLKSAKIAHGYVIGLWFEEAAEFDGHEEIDSVGITYVRERLPEGKKVRTFYSYNPPRNPYSWINKWVEDKEIDPNAYVHHSTYEEDSLGVLSEQFLVKAKRVKEKDPDYHDWVYGGKVTGLGDVVYNMKAFNVVDSIPNDDTIMFADITIDSGYSTSATTFLFIGYTAKGRSILLNTYYYSPVNQVVKKAPSDFSKDLWEFLQKCIKQWKLNIDTYTIDSAEAGLRNQFFKDYGIWLSPAKKSKKHIMIEAVQDLLALNKVYILDTPDNKIFKTEHRDYQWDPKKLKTENPEVIKVDDHTCDAFQYYVANNKDKLGLTL